MTQIIDRRLNAKNKSTVNRQRFFHRFKKQIKQAVENTISKRGITNIDSGGKITISKKDTCEPIFQHGKGGFRESVHPGNKEFIQGQHIKREPLATENGGSTASNEGEGLDNFVFELSRREFVDIFFEDLALPDLVKKQLCELPEHHYVHAGFTNYGVPTNLNVIRSMKNAIARRIAIGAPYKKKLRDAKKQLKELMRDPAHRKKYDVIESLKEQTELLNKKISHIPFIDNFDLRYNNRIKKPKPSTQAVMFCIMDVSGSMDENKKEIAKRFFILLYLFLTRNYEHIDIVFIRHHTSAKEVDEHEFFYSRETGGTVVSSALELMRNIIRERYPTSLWNIYGAQASDGDNWNADSPYCQKLLLEGIMPVIQYFSYIEIMPRHHQSIWEAYLTIKERYANFTMQHIDNLNDIYPVFRGLFQRQIV